MSKKWKLLMITMVMMVVLAACGSNTTETKSSEAAGSDTKQASPKSVELLNVSYDPTRELYDAYNKAFSKYWLEKTGQTVTIKQSHGGSGKQGRSVIDGLKADVVTLALAYDIDAIQNAKLINEGWQQRLENNSSPYTSTIVFLVRKGNPKAIKDWSDLIKDDVQVITPNPKTSGGARWNYLAAWGYALKQNNNDEEKAKQYIKELLKHVPVLDSGARGSTTTFVERGIGDVLLAWENEAILSVEQLGKGEFEIVYPSLSILAEPPISLVDKVVDDHGTREIAEEYLKYLYSKDAQEIIAKNYYRPLLKEVADQYTTQFPAIPLLTIDKDFGGWKAAQDKHFSDGGIFDQIYAEGK